MTSRIEIEPPRAPRVVSPMGVSKDKQVHLSQKVVWRIENFSKLNNHEVYSDTFSFDGRKWRIRLINPKPGIQRAAQMAVFLCPVSHTNDACFDSTLAVIDQKNNSRAVKIEVNGSGRVSLRHSELYSPDNGFLLDDTCIVEVEISKSKSKIMEDYVDEVFGDVMFFAALAFCLVVALVSIGSYTGSCHPHMIWITSSAAALVFSINKYLVASIPKFLPDDFLAPPLPAKVIQLVSNVDQNKVSKAALEKEHETKCENHKAVQEKTQAKVLEVVGSVKHPGAGQIFEGQAIALDGEVYEEIGGFGVKKSHASLYQQIWLKYGHIASNHVLTASSYMIQVMAVSDIMESLVDMSLCRFVEVTSEMIDLCEGMIKTAENLQFNIQWLREHFDSVKQGFIEMQKLKTTLQEEAQPIKAAKARVIAAEDELKKVQAQLTVAKEELKDKICASASRVSPLTISESEFEMYLEKGDTLLFDGVF